MKYKLLKKHAGRFAEWRDMWIANAMSTKQMDDIERGIVRKAVAGMYGAAGLTPPPDSRIIFVPSPLVATFAAGFASWIWYSRKVPAATDAATRAATRDAISLARWYTYQGNMLDVAKEFGDPRFLLPCAVQSYNMYSGGNQWSGWCSYVSFFRYIVELDIDYSKWDHFEQCTRHSGPRYMHKEFCIVSDRPERLLVDDRNRPHCDDGPFCRWRDGFSLYAIHGVRVPADVVLHPDRITVDAIGKEENAEVRRIMVEEMRRVQD